MTPGGGRRPRRGNIRAAGKDEATWRYFAAVLELWSRSGDWSWDGTMALAPPLDHLPLARDRHPPALGATLENPWSEMAPAVVLVSAVLEASAADIGWLAWLDGSEPTVVRREALSPVEPTLIAEFPEPPEHPMVIHGGARHDAWGLWCQGRGIRSCVVVPILARGKIIGTLGLASSSAGSVDHEDARQLELVSSSAVHARTYQARLAGQRRLFQEVSRTLENALALDRAIRQPPTYQEIARSISHAIDSTFCLIAIRDSEGALTLRATAGHRPPRRSGVTSWPLTKLPGCAQALRERRAIVLTFSHHDLPHAPERRALFGPTTRVGLILPFFAGPRTQGVLIVGEERRTRCQPVSPERVAILELVASRIAHILRISRRLEYERLGERRRQRQLAAERQRLAREVHDGVGQALTAVLVQVRNAMNEGNAAREDLQVLERTATRALDGARALAYGIRHLERGMSALEEARSFAETMLRSVHCRLSWTEERNDLKIASRVLREIAQVIKESITNVARHARATSVRVRVEYPDGRIRVTIRDDGVGFSLHEAGLTSDGLGLVGSAERLARVGGTLDVRSARNGGGTLVLIEARRH
ncbi:MAG: GAF domain-containing protein [Chloroflexi bacterium]|nr:MAG: GAF domain-containing protein [Chloroflexota bacterium]